MLDSEFSRKVAEGFLFLGLSIAIPSIIAMILILFLNKWITDGKTIASKSLNTLLKMIQRLIKILASGTFLFLVITFANFADVLNYKYSSTTGGIFGQYGFLISLTILTLILWIGYYRSVTRFIMTYQEMMLPHENGSEDRAHQISSQPDQIGDQDEEEHDLTEDGQEVDDDVPPSYDDLFPTVKIEVEDDNLPSYNSVSENEKKMRL